MIGLWCAECANFTSADFVAFCYADSEHRRGLALTLASRYVSGASHFPRLTSSSSMKEEAKTADKWAKAKKEETTEIVLLLRGTLLLPFQLPFLPPWRQRAVFRPPLPSGGARLCGWQRVQGSSPPEGKLTWRDQRIPNPFPPVSVGLAFDR